jgi:tetratricopeptide (TPR) repeat protein
VEACPPSATYRLRKLARKHRAAMATLAGFTAVILIAAIVSTLLAIRATTAERLASQRLKESEEARRQAEAVSRRLVDMFRRTDPTLDGRQLKVVDLLDQVTRDLDAEFPEASKIKGDLLFALGSAYGHLGLDDRAAELGARALSVRQAALGPDHPDTLKTMFGVAEGYVEVGRTSEAIPRLEEVVRLQKDKLGPDHPDTLLSMFVLAWAYRWAGRLDEATSLSEEVLRLRKAKLGPDHPDTLDGMWGVAMAYWSDGRLFEAIPLLEEVFKLRRAKLGPDHIWTIQSRWGLAGAYQEADRLDEAIRLSEEAVELYNAKLGPNYPNTLEAKAVHAGILGRMRLQQQKYDEAEPLLRQDLSRRERGSTWSRSHLESLLGESLLGQKKFGDAEPLLIKGYEGLKEREAKIPAPLKHHLTEAGERVVRLYDEWGKPDEAAKWRAELARRPPAENNKTKP